MAIFMPETDDLSGQMICLDEIGQREYSSSDNSYVCKRQIYNTLLSNELDSVPKDHQHEPT